MRRENVHQSKVLVANVVGPINTCQVMFCNRVFCLDFLDGTD